MKEANLQRLRPARFQLYDVLEKAGLCSEVCQELEEGGVHGGPRGTFSAVKLSWQVLIITHLSKPTDYATPRPKPPVHYGPWEVAMRQRGRVGCDRRPTLLWDADSGAGVQQNSLYFPSVPL